MIAQDRQFHALEFAECDMHQVAIPESQSRTELGDELLSVGTCKPSLETLWMTSQNLYWTEYLRAPLYSPIQG